MFRRRQGSTPYARYCGVEDSWLALITSILGLGLRKIGPRAILRDHRSPSRFWYRLGDPDPTDSVLELVELNIVRPHRSPYRSRRK
jgi:hypothetical protein